VTVAADRDRRGPASLGHVDDGVRHRNVDLLCHREPDRVEPGLARKGGCWMRRS
jgi:hypothetical protein